MGDYPNMKVTSTVSYCLSIPSPHTWPGFARARMKQQAARQASHSSASTSRAPSADPGVESKGAEAGSCKLRSVYPSAIPSWLHTSSSKSASASGNKETSTAKVELDALYARRYGLFRTMLTSRAVSRRVFCVSTCALRYFLSRLEHACVCKRVPRTRAYTHGHTYTHTHTNTHKHTQTHTHTHTNIHVHAHMRACRHACMQAGRHTRTHTLTRTCTHTRTHAGTIMIATCMCKHAHIASDLLPSSALPFLDFTSCVLCHAAGTLAWLRLCA